jgi:hypothetical protein
MLVETAGLRGFAVFAPATTLDTAAELRRAAM